MNTEKTNLENEKPALSKGAVSGSLRADALEWFFAKSEIEKKELKDKHFASEYIAHDSQWGYNFTFGQIEKMYVSERG